MKNIKLETILKVSTALIIGALSLAVLIDLLKNGSNML
jgi:hypothetical protein